MTPVGSVNANVHIDRGNQGVLGGMLQIRRLNVEIETVGNIVNGRGRRRWRSSVSIRPDASMPARARGGGRRHSSAFRKRVLSFWAQ